MKPFLCLFWHKWFYPEINYYAQDRMCARCLKIQRQYPLVTRDGIVGYDWRNVD